MGHLGVLASVARRVATIAIPSCRHRDDSTPSGPRGNDYLGPDSWNQRDYGSGEQMVMCSNCGAENQQSSVYCANCGIPVRREQGEPLENTYRATFGFLIAMSLGVLLLGLGVIISQFSGSIGMSGNEAVGYAMMVVGILVLGYSVIMFGRRKRRGDEVRDED